MVGFILDLAWPGLSVFLKPVFFFLVYSNDCVKFPVNYSSGLSHFFKKNLVLLVEHSKLGSAGEV